jgi:hypothetical protein
MRTLAVDIDSTIYDFAPLMHQALYEVCGVECAYEDVSGWNHWFTLAPKDDVIRAFNLALDPRKVGERTLYPGVVRALAELYDEGVRTHFITTNMNPEPMRIALAKWLAGALMCPFGLSVTKTGEKLPIMRRVSAFGIVDDRPDFIESVADEGFWAATKIHPWNREVVERRPDVFGFNHWDEVPGAVLSSAAA